MLLSQFVLLSPSPTVSTSLFSMSVSPLLLTKTYSIWTRAVYFIYIYHGFSNLIIIWIKIYFPEEILNVKFGWNNISGKKYMEMAHKILKNEKKIL